jgi:hypothetical protein
VIQQALSLLFLWPTAHSSLWRFRHKWWTFLPGLNLTVALQSIRLRVGMLHVFSHCGFRQKWEQMTFHHWPSTFHFYMWELKPFYVWSVHFSTHSHCCLLTLWIWEVFLRDSPSSCLSANSYRRETYVVPFHL